jgi:hypothetical protein
MPRHQEIEFVVQDRPDLGAVEIVPAVDGVLLTTMVAAYEAAAVRACRPYGGLVPARYRFGAMDRHFRGGSTESFGPATPVLACGDCGDWVCWPLLCRIGVSDDEVVWDAFAQPRRPIHDYGWFGPFRFTRDGYEDALGDLALCMA